MRIIIIFLISFVSYLNKCILIHTGRDSTVSVSSVAFPISSIKSSSVLTLFSGDSFFDLFKMGNDRISTWITVICSISISISNCCFGFCIVSFFNGEHPFSPYWTFCIMIFNLFTVITQKKVIISNNELFLFINFFISFW